MRQFIITSFYNVTPMTLAGMGVIYKRLRNEEQRELGFAAFQQPSMTSALVAAITDILLIYIAVAGLQFADKGAFRYLSRA